MSSLIFYLRIAWFSSVDSDETNTCLQCKLGIFVLYTPAILSKTFEVILIIK